MRTSVLDVISVTLAEELLRERLVLTLNIMLEHIGNSMKMIQEKCENNIINDKNYTE